MRSRIFLLVMLVAACAPAASAPRTASTPIETWLAGARSATCSARLRIEYPADPNAREDIVLGCDDRGATLQYAGTNLEMTRAASERATVERIWQAALAHVTDGECHTREEARAGKRIPDARSFFSLGYGGRDLGCASTRDWESLVAELRAFVRAIPQSSLPDCRSASTLPCRDHGDW